jgi:hypothetical protein
MQFSFPIKEFRIVKCLCKYQPSRKERDIERIDVADVLTIYLDGSSSALSISFVISPGAVTDTG